MSFFNFFKKNKPKEIKVNPDITVTDIDEGSHGDNIGALIGFETLNDHKGQQYVNQRIQDSITVATVDSYDKYEIRDVSISDHPSLYIRTLHHKKTLISAFPYLKTTYHIPFETKEIIQWNHMQNAEAEIRGGGRDTFGLSLFPTDFATKKETYLQRKNVDLHMSAFALVLDKSDLTQSGEVKFAEDFVSYMPSNSLPRQTYFDFIGKVIDCQEVTLDNIGLGYVAKVRLINDDDNPDFFTIDMFINKANMRISEISEGMKVSGLMWLQGEIA